ncbi:helix-turn-helix domain-containing protein [Burkholderia vietnamiensis]|uniref:helix-turn-helix domain-containing protein n=1 Tax=Burkholderia vietnamiensis TaxID=60552 RepID=UPI00158B1BD4|nr:helix-turn-helix transcriptional regulator [Burkholderia vietnamiensis]
MSTLFAQRLKDARQRAGLSQEALGIEAGLDPMSASVRMNRYELAKRTPDLELVIRIAQVLGVPAAYFYATSDDEATLLLKFHRLTKSQRAKVFTCIDEIAT